MISLKYWLSILEDSMDYFQELMETYAPPQKRPTKKMQLREYLEMMPEQLAHLSQVYGPEMVGNWMEEMESMAEEESARR